MKISFLLLLLLLLFGLPVFANAAQCISNNALLITKGHPTSTTIKSICLNYDDAKKSWISTIDEMTRAFPIDKWDAYTEEGGLIIENGKVKLIKTTFDEWNLITPQCPYGDAIITNKGTATVISEVSCINWNQKKHNWEVVYLGTTKSKSKFLNPSKVDVYTMDGQLTINNGKVELIPTYLEK